MPLADRGGTRTYWRYWGGADRRAILIHCGLARSDAWSGLAGILQGRLAMVAFDMPGHGQSGPWDERLDYQLQALRMAAALAEMDAPVDLVGHSFGATVALRLAVERPDLVRSLTLIEPVMFAVAETTDPAAYADHVARTGAYVTAMGQGRSEDAARAFIGVWGAGDPLDELPPDRRERLVARMKLIVASEAALYGDCNGLLAPGRLEGVSCPVLLIEGAASPPIVAAIQAGLADRLPDTRRVVVAGAAHMVPITHPAPVAAEIARFLSLG